jgi:hypothetical protein
MNTENELLAKSLVKIRAACSGVIFKHADSMTTGIPDVSWTALGKTSWWEWKWWQYRHSKEPKIRDTGLQRFTMCRLEANGFAAYYFVFEEHQDDVKRIWAVAPRDVKANGTYLGEVISEGKQYSFTNVVEFMQKVQAR